MKIIKSRYVQALKLLILFSAITHMLILAAFAVYRMDFRLLNYFNILDLDFFFPNIAEGMVSQILAAALMVAIYVAMFFFFAKPSKRNG